MQAIPADLRRCADTTAVANMVTVVPQTTILNICTGKVFSFFNKLIIKNQWRFTPYYYWPVIDNPLQVSIHILSGEAGLKERDRETETDRERERDRRRRRRWQKAGGKGRRRRQGRIQEKDAGEGGRRRRRRRRSKKAAYDEEVREMVVDYL